MKCNPVRMYAPVQVCGSSSRNASAVAETGYARRRNLKCAQQFSLQTVTKKTRGAMRIIWSGTLLPEERALIAPLMSGPLTTDHFDHRFTSAPLSL